MNNVTIAIASDHAGFEMKQVIMKYLDSKGISYHDFGAYSNESTDYADWAHPMAAAVEDGKFSFGISLCGSGNGINMTVNKHQGIRSALCWTPEIAALAKQHNNANILSMPARFISESEGIAILEAYMNATFDGGRHLVRIQKIPVENLKK